MDKAQWESRARQVIDGYLDRNDGCFDAEMHAKLTACNYDEQKISIEFETLKWQINERGGIHGGAIAGMFDTALGVVANFAAGTIPVVQECSDQSVDSPIARATQATGHNAVRASEAATVEMNISYIRPVEFGQNRQDHDQAERRNVLPGKRQTCCRRLWTLVAIIKVKDTIS